MKKIFRSCAMIAFLSLIILTVSGYPLWAATYRGKVQTTDATYGSGDSFYNKNLSIIPYSPAIPTALTITGGTTILNGSTVQGWRGIFVDPSGSYAMVKLYGASVSTLVNIIPGSYWAAVALEGTGAWAEIYDSTITGNGVGTHGLLAANSAHAWITNSSITANGINSNGLYAYGGDYYIAMSGGSVTVNGAGGSAVKAEGAGGSGIILNNTTVTANGAGTNGLYAEDGGYIAMSGGSVTANGAGGSAVKAEGASSGILINNNAVISTNGVGVTGLYAQDGGSIAMSGGSVSTAGAASHAVISSGSDSEVDIEDADVSTSGIGSYGLYANGGGSIFMDDGTVSTSGLLGSHAVISSGSGSEISLNDVHVSTNGIWNSAVGLYAYGIYAAEGGEVDMDGGSVSTTGALSHGAVADGDGSLISMTNAGDVSTEGLGAYGLYANNGGRIFMDDGTVSTSGLLGSHAVISSGSGSEISLNDVHVSTNGIWNSAVGLYAYGIYAAEGGEVDMDGGSVSTTGALSHGAVADGDGSLISMTNAGDVSTEGLGAYGLYANNGGRIYMNGGSALPAAFSLYMQPVTTISTTGDYAHAVVSSGTGSAIYLSGVSVSTEGDSAYGLYADDGGYISMTGGEISSLSESYMYVSDGGHLDLSGVTAGEEDAESLIVTDSSGIVTAADGTILTGNVRHTGDSDGNLDLILSTGSSLTGTVNSNINNLNAGINVTLLDNSAVWNVTGASITDGSLSNAGTVDYQFSGTVDPETMSYVVPDSDYSGYKIVSVSDFNGLVDSDSGISGTLKMKADINANEGDLLYIAGTATGENLVDVQIISNSGADRMDGLIVVDDSEATASFSLADPDGVVDAGAWNYILAEGSVGSAKEWYLKRNGLTTVGQGIVGSVVDSEIWYTEVGTLFDRLKMYKDGYAGGVWANAVAKKVEFDGGVGSVFDEDFRTVSLGYDKKFDRDNGALYQGGMIGYGTADRDITNSIGNTDIDSFHASLYSMYRSNNGFYIAGLLKFNHYKSDMTINKLDDFSAALGEALGFNTVTGEYENNGFGASMMLGKRIDTGSNGWYWEPQLQLSWMRLAGDDYSTNSGIDVDISDSDSIQARGGVMFGRSVITSNGMSLDIYGKASIVHEFDGETDITMSGGKWTSDLGGTWGVYEIGLNWQIAQRSYFNASFQYADGDNRTQPWGAQVGFSFEM